MFSQVRIGGLAVVILLALTTLYSRVPAPAAPKHRSGTPMRNNDGRIRYSGAQSALITLPDGQTTPVHSVLDIQTPMRFGDYVWNEKGVADGPKLIRVDLSRQMISVFRNGDEIGTAVILYGADKKATPEGRFKIIARAAQHQSSLYDAEMPYMLRLTNDGIAIHASRIRRGSATHGCIGVPLDFARLLYEASRVGDEVVILSEPQQRKAQQT